MFPLITIAHLGEIRIQKDKCLGKSKTFINSLN